MPKSSKKLKKSDLRKKVQLALKNARANIKKLENLSPVMTSLLEPKKPEPHRCYDCGAPALRLSEVGTVHINLLSPLKELVRVIRDFQCGDYSPIMDEIFEAEHAIRLADGMAEKGIDYD